MIKEMLASVRYYFLSFAQLNEVSSSELVPKDKLIGTLLTRLKPHEASKAKIKMMSVETERRLNCGTQFEYELDPNGNPKGIIYWLGCNEGSSKDWQNPDQQHLKVRSSSTER